MDKRQWVIEPPEEWEDKGKYVLELRGELKQRGIYLYFDKIREVPHGFPPYWEIYLEDHFLGSLEQDTNRITNLEECAQEVREDPYGITEYYFLPRKDKKRKPKFDRQITAVRKALKSLCPSLSVRGEQGIVYNWIEISGSRKHGEFTKEEERVLEELGIPVHRDYAVISPENTSYLVDRAKEMRKNG